MYEFLGLNRIIYYITKNLPFTALPWDLTCFKYWTQTLDFPTESEKNRLWSISFVTTPWEQTKVHAHFLEVVDVLFTRLATNLHPSMQLGDLSILQTDSLASIQKKRFSSKQYFVQEYSFFWVGEIPKGKVEIYPWAAKETSMDLSPWVTTNFAVQVFKLEDIWRILFIDASMQFSWTLSSEVLVVSMLLQS